MLIPFIYGAGWANSGWKGFRTGAISAGILWFGSAVYQYLTGAEIIAGRMADLLYVGNPVGLILLTGGLAAICAGFACSSGYLLKRIVYPKLET